MSESYAILPLDSRVRDFLRTQGCADIPTADGRRPTVAELKAAVASLPGVSVRWVKSERFPDGFLTTSSGLSTSIIMGNSNDAEPADFHCRGGSPELVEQVTRAISKRVGPLAIYAHSGCFTKAVSGS